MTAKAPQFDQSDSAGSTTALPSTVGTSWTAVPAVAGGPIQAFLLICKDQLADRELYVSYDGGTTTAATLYPNGHLAETIRGGQTQIHLKGNMAGVAYELTLEREQA